MANLRAIRTRIKSVENTRQITKSMKMVAASKLRRTQESYAGARSFADRCAQVLREVCPDLADCANPFLGGGKKDGPVCYVFIAGNRGLCGTYNSALLRCLEDLAAADGRDCFLAVCGRWGRDQIEGAGFRVERSFEISDTPTAREAGELSAWLRELYREGKAGEVVLVYQQYRSALIQRPVGRTLLPLSPEAEEGPERQYIFEPDRASLADRLADLVIDSTVHAVLLESRTGEHSARMTAMSAASDNTEELIGKLTLQLNHARQAAITTEISEIVGGAEALSGRDSRKNEELGGPHG